MKTSQYIRAGLGRRSELRWPSRLAGVVAGLLVATDFSLQAGSDLTSASVQELSANPISHSTRAAARQTQSLVAVAAVPTRLYIHGNPTAEEQFMLELINRARANPAIEAARLGIDLNEGIVADPISATPKQPLAFSIRLLQAARGHSQWMLDQDSFSHYEGDSSSPVDPADRMRVAGYVFNGSYSYGENIAWRGTTGSPLPVGPTVQTEYSDLFIDQGIEHRGHRVNLMTDSFREVGIGVGVGTFTSAGRDFNAVMVTQDFAFTSANPGPFLVGVVYRDSDGDGFYTSGEGLAGLTVMPASGASYATTSSSGGYALPLTGLTGSLGVTFSGGPLAAPVTKSILLTGENVKLDFEANADSVATFGFAAGSARRSLDGNFEADLYGPANTLLSIEASENMSQWNKISDVTLTAGATHFTDAQTSGKTHRFYRAATLGGAR